MPTRWSPLRAFAWGACFGALTIVFRLLGSWDASQLLEQLGGLLGGTALTGFIFALVAVARNRVVGA
jgi:hypothetical protein